MSEARRDVKSQDHPLFGPIVVYSDLDSQHQVQKILQKDLPHAEKTIQVLEDAISRKHASLQEIQKCRVNQTKSFLHE